MKRALNWQLIVGLALILGWLVIGFGAPFLTAVDPLKAHTDLLGKYTDTDIHNVTAYLVTLK